MKKRKTRRIRGSIVEASCRVRLLENPAWQFFEGIVPSINEEDFYEELPESTIADGDQSHQQSESDD